MFNPYLLNLSADKKKIFGCLLLVSLISFVGSQFLIAGDYEAIYAFICLNVITVRLVLELIFNMAKIGSSCTSVDKISKQCTIKACI